MAYMECLGTVRVMARDGACTDSSPHHPRRSSRHPADPVTHPGSNSLGRSLGWNSGGPSGDLKLRNITPGVTRWPDLSLLDSSFFPVAVGEGFALGIYENLEMWGDEGSLLFLTPP